MRKMRRGFALVLVLFLVFVMSILAYAAAYVATLDARGASAEVLSANALFAARAGISRALVRLGKDPDWASTPETRTIGEGQFTVTSVFHPSVNWWKVTSVGTVGGVSHTVEAWLGPLSFAEFAYFTDSEKSPSGGTVSFVTADKLTGKVHSNGYMSINGKPKFSKKVTTSNEGDSCYNSTTKNYKQGSTTTSDRSKFYRYTSNYTTDRPQALDGSPAFSFQGATARYELQGRVDLDHIESVADIKIEPNPAQDVSIVFNPAGTVTISYTGFSETYPLTSTTIYVDTGSVSRRVTMHGTVKGQVTVAVRGQTTSTASNGINIDDDLVYADKSVDTLGIVTDAADDVSGSTIQSTAIMVTTDPNTFKNIEIDATMIAPNGSFMVRNYNTGIPRGTLTVFGGIIQKNRGPVGTSSGSSIATGYAKNYIYDTKLIKTPPPNYPITGKVFIKSFIDKGALK